MRSLVDASVRANRIVRPSRDTARPGPRVAEIGGHEDRLAFHRVEVAEIHSLGRPFQIVDTGVGEVDGRRRHTIDQLDRSSPLRGTCHSGPDTCTVGLST